MDEQTTDLTQAQIEALGLADTARLQSAYHRLRFRYAALEHAQAAIARHDSHYEYDPMWIAAGEDMDALWLAMGTLLAELGRRNAEWVLPAWEEGDEEPF